MDADEKRKPAIADLVAGAVAAAAAAGLGSADSTSARLAANSNYFDSSRC